MSNNRRRLDESADINVRMTPWLFRANHQTLLQYSYQCPFLRTTDSVPVRLVVELVGFLPQILHVRADQHLPQLHEIAMVFVFDLDRPPRVLTDFHLWVGWKIITLGKVKNNHILV